MRAGPGRSAAVMDDDQEFLTIQAATQRYRVSRRTLYRLVAAGRLVRFRRPGDARTYLRVDQLDEQLRLQPVPVPRKPAPRSRHN